MIRSSASSVSSSASSSSKSRRQKYNPKATNGILSLNSKKPKDESTSLNKQQSDWDDMTMSTYASSTQGNDSRASLDTYVLQEVSPSPRTHGSSSKPRSQSRSKSRSKSRSSSRCTQRSCCDDSILGQSIGSLYDHSFNSLDPSVLREVTPVIVPPKRKTGKSSSSVSNREGGRVRSSSVSSKNSVSSAPISFSSSTELLNKSPSSNRKKKSGSTSVDDFMVKGQSKRRNTTSKTQSGTKKVSSNTSHVSSSSSKRRGRSRPAAHRPFARSKSRPNIDTEYSLVNHELVEPKTKSHSLAIASPVMSSSKPKVAPSPTLSSSNLLSQLDHSRMSVDPIFVTSDDDDDGDVFPDTKKKERLVSRREKYQRSRSAMDLKSSPKTMSAPKSCPTRTKNKVRVTTTTSTTSATRRDRSNTVSDDWQPFG